MRLIRDFQQQQQQQSSRHFAPQQPAPYGNANPRPETSAGFRGYGADVDPERVSEGGIRGGLMDTGPGILETRRPRNRYYKNHTVYVRESG